MKLNKCTKLNKTNLLIMYPFISLKKYICINKLHGIIDQQTLDPQGNTLINKRICIKNNKNQSFVNIDAEHDFKGMSRDILKYDCTLEPIKLVRNEK